MESTEKHWLETILEGPYFWGVLSFIETALAFSPRESGLGTWILLALAWGTTTVGVWFHPSVRRRSRRLLYTGLGALLITIALTPLGFWLTSRQKSPKQVAQLPVPATASPAPDLSELQKSLDEINKRLAQQGHPTISTTQAEAMKAVADFFRGDEISLRQEFGYPSMLSINVAMIRDCFLHYQTNSGKSCDWSQFATGETYLDWNLGQNSIRRQGGAIVFALDLDHIGILEEPKQCAISKAVLKRFENSPELPNPVIDGIREFDDATEKNTDGLLRVLHDAAKENGNYFLRYDDPSSPQFFHQIDARWFSTFIQLRPKADKITDALRRFIYRN